MPSLNILIESSSNTATDKFTDPYFSMPLEDATHLPPVYVLSAFSITTAPEIVYEVGEPEVWSVVSFSVTTEENITASPSSESEEYDANTVSISANGSYFVATEQAGPTIVFTAGTDTPFDDKFRFLMGSGDYNLFSNPSDAREEGFSDLIRWLHPSYTYVTVTHNFAAEITNGSTNQIITKSLSHNVYFDYIAYISIIEEYVQEGSNNAISF